MEYGMRRRGHAQRTAALACSMLFVSSCATLIDPHVGSTVERPGEVSVATVGGIKVARFDGNEKVELPEAITYAQGFRDNYMKAAATDTVTRNVAGAALIPLSAAGLFLGVTSSSRAARDSILALGLGGASVFGGATLLTSKDRQTIWYDGAQAMDCVIRAYTPFSVPKETFDAFTAVLADAALPTHLGEARAAHSAVVDAIMAAKAVVGDPKLIDEAQVLADTADALIIEGGKTYAAALKTQGTLLGLGRSMVGQVDGIDREVQKAIAGTTPDLAAFKAVAVGLGAFSLDLTTVPQSVIDAFNKAKGAGAPPGPLVFGGISVDGKLRTRMNELISAVETLDRDLAKVRAVHDTISAQGDAVATAGTCSFSATASAIKLEPDAPLTFKKGTAAQQIRVVSGATAPYSATLSTFPLDGVAISGPGLGDDVLRVSVSDKAAAGTHQIVVRSANGKTKVVDLEITDGVDTTKMLVTARTGSRGVINAVGDFEGGLSAAQGELIQEALCVKAIDHNFGPETRGAIRRFNNDYGIGESDVLTEVGGSALLRTRSVLGRCDTSRFSSWEEFTSQ